MYKERKANIAAFRGCDFNCVYCAFSKMLKLSNCPMCKSFKPHSHMEVLGKTPPKTKEGEFLTIGLSSDISFMDVTNFYDVLDYCSKWGDRTFLIQSKNPEWFLQFYHRITSNVIIGTTIESNRFKGINYKDLSKGPNSYYRYCAMVKLNCRKAVTIEPILDFNGVFEKWIQDIKPEIVWIGYDSRPNRNHLPEPTLQKTQELIKCLEDSGISVHQKLIRKAWYETRDTQTPVVSK